MPDVTVYVDNIPPGTIVMWNGAINEIPSGWALCDGRDGRPDLSGKFIVGYDPTDKDYNKIGMRGGEKMHTLTVAEIPSHTHDQEDNGTHSHKYSFTSITTKSDQDDQKGSGGWLINPPESMSKDTEEATHTHKFKKIGNDCSHENRPPYFTLAFIIKLKPR